MLKRMSVFVMVMLLAVGALSGCSKTTPENLIETELIIEGLTGEYDILFVSDSHVVVNGDDSAEVEEYKAQRLPMFQNEKGVTSEEQFVRLMQYANREKADAILFGGDIVDNPSAASIEFLDEQLSSLEIPYLYTLGNHDWTFPWNYMTEDGKQSYLPLFEPFMNGNTAIQKLDMGEFVIVAVDNSSGQVNAGALEEYAKVLSGDKPVVVLAHVPLLTDALLDKVKETHPGKAVILGDQTGAIVPNESSAKFLEMTLAGNSPVEAVLAGHVHFHNYDIVSGEKNIVQILARPGYQDSVVRIHIKGTVD